MSGFAKANQYLASKGVPSSKFDTVGTSHTGIQLDVDVAVVTDTNGVVQLRKDGITPKEQIVLTWQTDERDPANPADTGIRKLYCSWRLEEAIKKAWRYSENGGGEEGGILTVKFVSEEKVPGFAGKAKLYDVSYTSPKATTGFDKGIGAVDTIAEAKADYPEAMVQLALTLNANQTPYAVIAQATGIPEDYLANNLLGV